MNRWLSFIMLVLSTMLPASCVNTHLPTDQELKVVNDLQGKWEGKQYESGWWHVYGDSKTGDTDASGTLVFIGQRVIVTTINTPNPFWRREDQYPRIPSDSYERVYVINAGNEVVFPGSCRIHKMIFRFTGPDTLEGYRDDFPSLGWKFQRVAGK
jgi:hypothetical protein